MFCMKCGTQLPDDALFCYKCGNKINVSVQQTETASAAKTGKTAKPDQNKNSYRIGNKIIRFNEEYAIYTQIVKVLNQQSKKAINKFSHYYEEWDDASTASDKAYGTFYSLLEEGFLSCKDIALQNGVYDYSPSKIDKYTWTAIRKPFVSAYSNMSSQLNSINSEQKNEELAREIRKENRFRVVGGGFGVTGAVKGMAMAGAINLGTGIAHSAFNVVGDIFSSLSASSARSDLYNRALGQLIQGIRESFELLLPEIAKIITGKVHVDKKKELTIFKHIKDGSFGKDVDLRDPFAEAFYAFPFDEELYVDYIHRFPKEEKKIMAMGKDLGIDIEEIFSSLLHYNGFVFHSILAAEFVRASEEPFFNAINELGKFSPQYNGEKVYKRLSRILNTRDGLKEMNSLEVVRGLKARYAVALDLPAGYEEVQEYRAHKEQFFSDMESAIAKTCQETPLKLNVNIGSSGIFIAFILRLCKIVNDSHIANRFNSWDGHLYIGADITPEVEKEIRDTIWCKKDASDIYLYYHNGKKGRFEYETYLALTSDGIVQQDNSIRYHNLEVRFDKGKLIDDLVVNNETWSISLSGENLLWIVNVIENLQPFSEAVEHVIECKKGGIIKQDLAWLHDIGVLYIKGDPRIGLEKDYAKAKYWFQKAASLGEEDSKRILSKYLEEIEPADEQRSMADFAFPANYDGVKANDSSITKTNETKINETKTSNEQVFYNDLTPATVNQGFAALRNSLTQEDLENLDSVGERLYILDAIPEKKAKNVANSYAKKWGVKCEDIKLLFDSTFFGNAKDGMIMTNQIILKSESEQFIPITQVKYLQLVMIDDKKYQIYVEPMHSLVIDSIGNIESTIMLDVVDKINRYIFGYPEKSTTTIGSGSGNETSTTSQYVCPTCGQLINYKDAFCDNCGTQLSWGSDTSESTQTTSDVQQYECPVCKHLINYKDAFCDNCGTQISWE